MSISQLLPHFNSIGQRKRMYNLKVREKKTSIIGYKMQKAERTIEYVQIIK